MAVCIVGLTCWRSGGSCVPRRAPSRRTGETRRPPGTRPCRRPTSCGIRSPAPRAAIRFPTGNRRHRRPTDRAAASARRNRHAGMADHADRRRIDAARPPASMLAAASSVAMARPAPKRAAQIAGEGRRPSLVGVDDRQFADPQGQQRMRDRRPGAASAKLRHAPPRRIGQLAGEAFGESGPVGIVPGRPAVRCENDRIDGADRPRVGRQGAEQRDDRLFAWMGDVEPGEPEAARRHQQFGQGRRRQLQGIEIDQAIEVRSPWARPSCSCRAGDRDAWMPDPINPTRTVGSISAARAGRRGRD